LQGVQLEEQVELELVVDVVKVLRVQGREDRSQDGRGGQGVQLVGFVLWKGMGGRWVILEPTPELLEVEVCGLDTYYFFVFVIIDEAIYSLRNGVNIFILVIKTFATISNVQD
jgi:hypothetical protein